MRKNFISICCIIMFMASTCFANEPLTVKLWDTTTPPTDNGIPAEMEIIERPNWISNVATPELFVFLSGKPDAPTLLMCPGGGYEGVAIQHEGTFLSTPLNEHGVNLAVLKYRMPNGNSGVPAEDVNRAFEILKENASEWGINPDRIGIGGASAGGHLASTVATHPELTDLKPAFQVLLYPVVSMKEGVTHQGSRLHLIGDNPTEELIDYYTNELHVTPQTPQAFIAVSGDDTGVPAKNSIDYFNALTANGVPVSLHVYPQGGHGWGYRPGTTHSDVWMTELLYWLDNLQLP